MYAGKPIIGIAGGIGSGKSHVAGLFARLGCAVIDSDAQVRAAYRDPAVRDALRQWWGESAFMPDGEPDRQAISRRIFADPAEDARLKGLLHPWVAAARSAAMERAAADPSVLAYVWDTPLLYETGLNRGCDAVVFVDASRALRAQRLLDSRGWTEQELQRRENFQWPLDKKRLLSDYVLSNAANDADLSSQVRDVLSQTLAKTTHSGQKVPDRFSQ